MTYAKGSAGGINFWEANDLTHLTVADAYAVVSDDGHGDARAYIRHAAHGNLTVSCDATTNSLVVKLDYRISPGGGWLPLTKEKTIAVADGEVVLFNAPLHAYEWRAQVKPAAAATNGTLGLYAYATHSDAEIDRSRALRLVATASYTCTSVNATLADAFTAASKANLVDGETFTITDENGDVTTFEMDVNGTGVTAGNVQVDVSGATTADDVGVIMITAITGAGIGITASTGSTADDVTLDADNPGVQGNRICTESVAHASFLVNTPMAAGADNVALTPTTDGVIANRCDIKITETSANAVRVVETASGKVGDVIAASGNARLPFMDATDTILYVYGGDGVAATFEVAYYAEPT